jgi:hypothetical protein
MELTALRRPSKAHEPASEQAKPEVADGVATPDREVMEVDQAGPPPDVRPFNFFGH